MKKYSLLLVAVLLISCGGGGDGGGDGVPESRTPSISNFQFTPTSGRFASGDVNVRGSIDFIDGGGDIKKIYMIIIQYYSTSATSYGYGYPAGTWGWTLDVSNFPPLGVSSGTINFNFNVKTGYNNGIWNIRIFVEDSEFNRSNELIGDFNVYLN